MIDSEQLCEDLEDLAMEEEEHQVEDLLEEAHLEEEAEHQTPPPLDKHQSLQLPMET